MIYDLQSLILCVLPEGFQESVKPVCFNHVRNQALETVNSLICLAQL